MVSRDRKQNTEKKSRDEIDANRGQMETKLRFPLQRSMEKAETAT